MNLKLNYEVTLTQINCGECGGIYAINERFREQKEKYGGYWKCPYCQCSWGFGTSTIDKLTKELEYEKKRTEWAKQDAKNYKHQLTAQKGVNTKLKKRIGHGVCPCCKRTFKQLAEHMKSQHPEYIDTNEHKNNSK